MTTADVFEYLLRVTSGDIDTGPFDIEVAVLHPISEFQATRDLEDATYQWRVIARDRALNTASSETRIFTVDTVAPRPPTAMMCPSHLDSGLTLAPTGRDAFSRICRPDPRWPTQRQRLSEQ